MHGKKDRTSNSRHGGNPPGKDRRRQLRHPSFEIGELKHRNGILTCQLTDFSSSGVQLVGRNGLIPSASERVKLRLPDGSVAEGRIVWLGRTAIGVEFTHLVEDILDRLDTTHFGLQHYVRIVASQINFRDPGKT